MSFLFFLEEDLVQDHDQKIKTRFLFVLLGPKNPGIDYLEIGRCMGALMANKVLSQFICLVIQKYKESEHSSLYI